MKKFAKNIKKILEKVCTCKNNAYLCIRNQEMSSYKTKQNVANRKIRKRLQKRNLKKVCKKFLKYLEVTKKGFTFATDFRLKLEAEFFKRFFDLLVI